MELTLLQRAEEAERATEADEFRIISEAALAVFGWQDDRYRRVLRLLEAGASLDAAMSLLLAGSLWGTGNEDEDNGRPWAWVLAPGMSWDSAKNHYAATPALALCAAALRARAQQTGERQ